MANSSQEPWALAPFSGTKIPNPSLRGAQQRSSLIATKLRSAEVPTSVVTIILGFTKRHNLLVIDRWPYNRRQKEWLLQAKEDWINQRFPKVPGETDFVPYPEAKR